MKSLVTGATGFIGSYLVDALQKKGEQVRALVRKTSNIDFLKKLDVEIITGDLIEADSLNNACQDVDKIFHSAALVGDWLPLKDTYEINVKGTANLLDSARDNKIKRFVYISTLGVLGLRDHYQTPDDPPGPKAHDAYIDTKIESEKRVSDFGRLHNTPFTIIRPGFVFGPRDKKIVPKTVDFIKKGKFVFIGNGQNKVNLIYVENLADITVKASNADEAEGQTYNVTNDSGLNFKEFISMIADIWQLPRPRTHIPKNLAHLVCALLEFKAKIYKAKKPPLLNKSRLKFLSLNLDFDISKIKQDLGYQPEIDIKEGLIRTRAWIQENKGIE